MGVAGGDVRHNPAQDLSSRGHWSALEEGSKEAVMGRDTGTEEREGLVWGEWGKGTDSQGNCSSPRLDQGAGAQSRWCSESSDTVPPFAGWMSAELNVHAYLIRQNDLAAGGN